MNTRLRTSFTQLQRNRHTAFSLSQEALRSSKKAIFCLQRDDDAGARACIRIADSFLKRILRLTRKFPSVRYDGGIKAAFEEYAEAQICLSVFNTGKVPALHTFAVSDEEYIGGLADATGECVRRATLSATNGHLVEVVRLKNIVTHIVDDLVMLNLTGYLRQKFDEAQRNLHKIEEIHYRMKV
ncbi:MAG: hypothetical protein WC289_02930 [Patescibacteria group bacterium]|jgi:predicted translin family RNA/ssDNA-binding protein